MRVSIKQLNGVTFCSHAVFICLIAALASQGVQSLVRNAVTQNTLDIQVSRVFSLIEHAYGACPV